MIPLRDCIITPINTENDIVVSLDAKYIIKEVIFQGLDHIHANMDFSILEGRHLADFYDIPGNNPVRDIVYRSLNRFENYESYYEFYSRLPFSSVTIRDFPDAGIVGIIRFNRLVQAAYVFHSNPFFMVDEKQKIQAVNRRFLEAAGLDGHPEACLDKPLEKFLAPNPIRLIAMKEAEIVALSREQWDAPQPVVRNRKWEPDGPGKNGLLALGPWLDPRTLDFRIEVRFTLLDGPFPCAIILGTGPEKGSFPDANGYFLGPDQGDGCISVKRGGELTLRLPWNRPAAPGPHRLEILRRADLVALLIDGEGAVGYRDSEPESHGPGLSYLYCRGKGRFFVESVMVSTLPRAASAPEFNEVSFSGRGDNTFRFHQFTSRYINTGDKFFYGFSLYDISPLRKDIRDLSALNLKTRLEGGGDEAAAFVGNSPGVLRIKKNAEAAAGFPVTVLIEGETGTGKEVLTRFIHSKSNFREGPFIKVDCTALPATLLESELFGYEKGAFTGAEARKPGKFEEAEAGTLFLDEIGNLPLLTQAKLLQFLQDFTFSRLGGNRRIKVQCRIIAASNQPLERLIEQGLFRSDLYYRLNAVKFLLEPLRKRREDIPALCQHFLDLYNKKFHKEITGFTAESYKKLMTHPWPGNIRELENTIQKAVLYCPENTISEEMLEVASPSSAVTATLPIPYGDARAFTAEHIRTLLSMHNGIVERAIKASKISRAAFFRKMKKFRIREI